LSEGKLVTVQQRVTDDAEGRLVYLLAAAQEAGIDSSRLANRSTAVEGLYQLVPLDTFFVQPLHNKSVSAS
jgi:hypothetical protein